MIYDNDCVELRRIIMSKAEEIQIIQKKIQNINEQITPLEELRKELRDSLSKALNEQNIEWINEIGGLPSVSKCVKHSCNMIWKVTANNDLYLWCPKCKKYDRHMSLWIREKYFTEDKNNYLKNQK
jgi:hypothetical protein